ncbi:MULTISPECIES: SLATT domain-containing protein [unclassified Caballeronia]|uniref:SLATT domain-containing protein n=1 Tax=unclassified Caballeronia TaxID=2646786 RepID=UPI00202984FE|nr:MULTISPECIES: SLATT domain-containing protein [unclassified Caballeronia]MDR5766901.1 SLATT domain-containing protein [Caballeronia sp. LZ028]
MTETSYQPPRDMSTLVLAWIRRARESQIRHYTMADRLTRCGRRLGLAVIGITAATGTSAFLSLVTTAVSPDVHVLIGMTSLSAAVLASLQTFLRYSERAELHRRAGAQYGAVRRRLEAIHAADVSLRDACVVDAVRDELDQIAQTAPHLPRA